MEVRKITKGEWMQISEKSHFYSFGEHKPKEWDRIDFALLSLGPEPERVNGYITCLELDRYTLYWQFGGAYQGTKGTTGTFKYYKQMVEWCKEQEYQRIGTRISNNNIPMLKMAFKVGFRVVGLRAYEHEIYLELVLELREED